MLKIDALTKPEWLTVIVAACTGVIVCWQSWETRKAAQAANRSIEVSKTKERAKLFLSVEQLNPVVGGLPEAKLRVTNVGESSAICERAIAGLHISDSETLVKNGTGYYWLKVESRILKSDEFSEETVWLPGHPFDRYTQAVIDGDCEFVHLHGIIIFRDAFDDRWRLRFHYIWRQYGGEVWMPHLEAAITGEWGCEYDDCILEKAPKNRWWQFWRKRLPRATRPPV